MKFELFGRLKKHGTPPAPMPSVRDVPIERVRELASEGVSEAEIIKTLKDAGYSFREIDEALNQAVKTGVSESAFGGGLTQQSPVSEEPPNFSEEDFSPQPADSDEGNAPGTDEYQRGVNAEELEEIVDSVTEEKIGDFKASAEEAKALVKEFEEKLKGFTASLEASRAHTDEVNAEAERKIGELHAKLEELEPKILGLERAFKDIMPNLVDSVREVKEAMHSMREKSAGAESEEPHEGADEEEQEEDAFSGGNYEKKPQPQRGAVPERMRRRGE